MNQGQEGGQYYRSACTSDKKLEVKQLLNTIIISTHTYNNKVEEGKRLLNTIIISKQLMIKI